jgi:spermidine/putrescine transport system permease protein
MALVARVRLRGPEAGSSRPPWALSLVTWAYLLWWFVPIALAIRISFAGNDLAGSPAGLSLQWYRFVVGDADLRRATLLSLAVGVATASMATPLGAAMAIGLHRWRSRSATALRGVVLVAVVTPQIAMALAMFLFLAYPLRDIVSFGVPAELLSHVTLAIPFVVLLVWGRLVMLGGEYEEMAMDLGASPTEAVRRVLMPLLRPALVAAATVAFVLSFDNFVLSDELCIRRDCTTLPVILFGGGRGLDPSPPLFAAGTLALAASLCTFAIGLAAARLALRQR